MVTTVVVVVATHDLAQGVLAGVLLSGIFFAGKVRRMFAVERTVSDDGATATFRVSGQIFFASVDRFTRAFQTEEHAPNVLIDMTGAHFWDISGVAALDKIVARLRRNGVRVEVVGYNRASADIVDRFALHDKTGFEIGVVPH
jgi:SulP family sulfate permease